MEQESEQLNSFTCLDPELGKQLPAFMDGTLEGKDLSVFESHLERCVRCSEDYLLRRETERLLTEHWQEVAPPPSASVREGDRRPWGFLLRRRVPALVPAALAAVVLLLLIPRGIPDPPDGQVWHPVTSVQNRHLAGRSRGAVETNPTWIVKPGDLLEITLGKIPSQGEPILLVIKGSEGVAGDPGLPFQIVEGFPLLQILIPDLPPESYTAEIISGPEGTPIHQITLVVETQ